MTIVVVPEVPKGAIVLGPVEAGRGHRDWRNDPPTEEDVVNDLKVAAYARGADGLAKVSFEKNSGLTDNYWWVIQGRATAWRSQLPAEKPMGEGTLKSPSSE
jgi:mannose-6-phosphate isomerase-like protein (cupin superfamily)